MTTLYPIGYGTSLVTLEDLYDRHAPRMHPEYARRLFNWLRAQDGHIGIGGGWRSTNPPKPGFAPDGKSFHQDQTFVDGFTGYCAVDLVARNGSNVHRAPRWDEVPVQGSDEARQWGVHANVSTESWHLQPVEIDGWQSWVNAGRPAPAVGYPIPGDPGDPIDPPDPDGFDPANGVYGSWPDRTDKPTLHLTSPQMSGDAVRYCQGVLAVECGLTLDVDGYYGPTTESRVRQMQGWNGLEQDGWCGPDTWATVDVYASRK